MSELVKSKTQEQIYNTFNFHKPTPEAVQSMANIRRTCRGLAYQIDTDCPESREKSVALTKLQEVMMFANSAIVQQFPVDEGQS